MIEAVEAKVKCLKKVLSKAKKELALEKKKWRVAQAKVTKAEKKIKGKIIEASRLVTEAFQGSKEFTNKKVKFGEEVFIAGQEDYCQKVMNHFLDLDFSFLYERKEETNDD